MPPQRAVLVIALVRQVARHLITVERMAGIADLFYDDLLDRINHFADDRHIPVWRSRIIELSKDPILKNERMCESSVPGWFYHSIADYTDADTDRDHDIKWFLDAVARVVDVAEDGKSFTFKPKAKQKYFERQYHAFLDKACELTGISLDAFVGEAKYDIGMAMYKLNEHYQDKFSLYVYFNYELKSLDEWIRETDLSGSFYFGGTLDYHY